MIELHRIVEDQARISSFRATQDTEKAIQLEVLIDLTKPRMPYQGWHDLIATQFRYPLPVGIQYSARFRPPGFGKNVFYASATLETSLYEYSYHLMRQRVHLQVGKRKVKNETGIRTGFLVNADDSFAFRVHGLPNAGAILDRNNYSASHQYVSAPPPKDFILYPSVRDPERRDTAAISDINKIQKAINHERQLNFFYNYRTQAVHWIDLDLTVPWSRVS